MKIERVRFVDYVPLKGGLQALDATSANYRLEYEPTGLGVLVSWGAGATLVPWGNVRSVSLVAERSEAGQETGYATGYEIGMKPVSPAVAPEGAGMVNAKVADVMGQAKDLDLPSSEPPAEPKRRGRPRKGYVLD